MGLCTWLAMAAAALAVLGGVFLQSNSALKLQVAVGLFGYDGLMDIAHSSIAERLAGQRPTEARRAFHELLDTMAEAERIYLGPGRGISKTEDISEGIRYLMHVLRTGLLWHLESDESRPLMVDMVSSDRKLIGDNPDAIYRSAYIDASGETTYVLRGSRLPGEVYTSLTLAEAPCMGCMGTAVFRDMQLHGDRFEVYIGGGEDARPAHVPAGATWMPGSKGRASAVSVQAITRHYFENELSAQRDISIAVNVTLSRVPALPQDEGGQLATSDEAVARRLKEVSRFLMSYSAEMSNDPTNIPPWFSFERNVFGPPTSFGEDGSKNAEAGGGMGAVDIVYSSAPFHLEPGQGLLIEGALPECSFANIMLWNRFLQTLDYEKGFTISLNRKQMRHLSAPDADGMQRFKIVLSSQRPKEDMQADWLNSMNRSDGTAFWRVILPKQKVPAISATVIDV